MLSCLFAKVSSHLDIVPCIVETSHCTSVDDNHNTIIMIIHIIANLQHNSMIRLLCLIIGGSLNKGFPENLLSY